MNYNTVQNGTKTLQAREEKGKDVVRQDFLIQRNYTPRSLPNLRPIASDQSYNAESSVSHKNTTGREERRKGDSGG